tara:strand:+ start:644 stop:874 length:231 start_codon:yes stop_codon:yes gene_type:complete
MTKVYSNNPILKSYIGNVSKDGKVTYKETNRLDLEMFADAMNNAGQSGESRQLSKMSPKQLQKHFDELPNLYFDEI